MKTSGGFSGTADTLVRSKTPQNRYFFRLVDLLFSLTWESMERRLSGAHSGATVRRSRPTHPSTDAERREGGGGGGAVGVRGPPGGRGPERRPKTVLFGGERRAVARGDSSGGPRTPGAPQV